MDKVVGNQLVEALTSISYDDRDKTEHDPKPNTETRLMKLISNIKNDMEADKDSTGGAPNENTNSLLLPDNRYMVP